MIKIYEKYIFAQWKKTGVCHGSFQLTTDFYRGRGIITIVMLSQWYDDTSVSHDQHIWIRNISLSRRLTETIMAVNLGIVVVSSILLMISAYYFAKRLRVYYLLSKFDGPLALPVIGTTYMFKNDPRGTNKNNIVFNSTILDVTTTETRK